MRACVCVCVRACVCVCFMEGDLVGGFVMVSFGGFGGVCCLFFGDVFDGVLEGEVGFFYCYFI